MTITVGAHAAEETGAEFGVLGPFQARIDGQWQTPPTRQIARVATMLAGWPGEVVEVDRIVAGVWGDRAPVTVRNTLQVHVSHLRRMVGRSLIRSSGDGYQLDLAPEAVDAGQFVEAVHEAARMRRREHFARAAQYLDAALALWRGTPFPDVADPDLEARRERLTELRDQAREDLLECRLELCRDGFDLAEVIADAKELVARQPLREKGHVLLVRALAAADRPAEASAAFEAAGEHLRVSVGLDPSRPLVDVHTRALTRDRSLLPRSMRTIRLVPEHPPADPATQAVAERIRAAVVDLGATVVTAIEADDAAARRAALAVAEALGDDMPAGVVVADAGSADVAAIARLAADAHALADPTPATATPTDPTSATADPDPAALDGLAVVVHGPGPQLADLAAAVTAGSAAALVVVGPQAIGLGTEVVVWDAAPDRGAATSARAAERLGA